jgi:hypothetical protein
LYLFISCVCFALGNVVPEPFAEDFQEQAFDESPFLFVELQDMIGAGAAQFC